MNCTHEKMKKVRIKNVVLILFSLRELDDDVQFSIWAQIDLDRLTISKVHN